MRKRARQCVCVRERQSVCEREKEYERERELVCERDKEIECVRERECVCERAHLILQGRVTFDEVPHALEQPPLLSEFGFRFTGVPHSKKTAHPPRNTIGP